nr:uncharacterized protein LOC109192561 [Ipomoea batatas]
MSTKLGSRTNLAGGFQYGQKIASEEEHYSNSASLSPSRRICRAATARASLSPSIATAGVAYFIFHCVRKSNENQESDFKDAASVCLPLITAAIKDIEKDVFPKFSSLNVEIPTSPLAEMLLLLCFCFNFSQGVALRLTTQRKSIEVVESVGVAGKSDPKQTAKYFRLEEQRG